MRRLLLAAICPALIGCSEDRTAGLIVQLKDENAVLRREAAVELGKSGSGSAKVVSALAGATTDADRDVRRTACHALGEIGPSAVTAVPALSEALNDRELSVRLSAAFAIQKIDSDSRAYVPELVSVMKMGEGGTIVAVGRMGGKAEWAVPTLIELLKDNRPGIRRLAAEALGHIGTAADNAVAALKKALNDPDDRVREAAEEALKKIDHTGNYP